MLDLTQILDNIKKIENVKQDKEVAKILKLKNDNLSQYKSRNVVPIKNIVEYCLSKNISIDEILNSKAQLLNKFLKNDSKKENVEIKFFESSEILSLPIKFLKDIELINLFAFNNNDEEIFLLNTLENIYTNSSKYLIQENSTNKKYISLINFENDKFIFMIDKKFNTLINEDFSKKYTILGKVFIEIKISNLMLKKWFHLKKIKIT